MKKAIFITVRTASTRLPKKCLLEIDGMRVIEFLITRLKRSRKSDIIVLCTTQQPEDDILCEIAKKNNIEYFRGPVEDKLMRWLKAANEFGIDFFITADGDDLFCDPELIDLGFMQFGSTNADFIEAGQLPCGSFTYGIKVAALEKVCRIKASEDTEMMWGYFKDTGLFKVESLANVPNDYLRPEIRMTLDYPDDFTFFKTVIEKLGGVSKDFNLKDIINLLDKNPEIIKINQYLQERFLENQKRKTKVIIKEVQSEK